MLSRTSSNATDRIRRAKSTTSAHSTASGHQRLPTVTDPFVLRRQAETAAIEAYTRARQQDEASAVESKPRLNRRRSQNNGRSEGSHLADARRRSIQSEANKQAVQWSHTSPTQSRSVVDEETIVTRRRSVIPPVVDAVALSQSPIAAPLRKRLSDHTDGSPAPRYSQLPEKPLSVLHARALEIEQADGYGGNLANLSSFAQGGNVQDLENVPIAEVSINEFQLTRPKRVRQRKSFLGSFQKRNGGFDTALPPFNHADAEGENAASSTGLSLGPITGVPTEQHKTRKFSDTLKSRLKKVFRKTSKMSMPIQHVHAEDFHFSVRDHDLSEVSFVDYTDPFMTVAAEEPKAQQQHKFATAHSTAQDSTSKSRVTSWANSTLAMSSVRTSHGPFAVPGTPRQSRMASARVEEDGTGSPTGEPPMLKRSDSNSTLRKASSFFGRPIRNKLRRTSKTDLRGSGESQGLYSALQRRIKTSRSTETANEIAPCVVAEPTTAQVESDPSALATLPSQRQYSTSSAPSSSMSSQTRHRVTIPGTKSGYGQTIRPVTPELAPVLEAASAEADRTVIHHELESPTDHTPKSALRRSHAVKAPPPSKEQLLNRKERAENRWTTALATGGLSTSMADNPYELSSLGRAHTPHTGLPPTSRADVISPSLYSRATDGASPRPDTPDDVGITTITITGREVRKYDISPPKHAHQHQSSKDWRKWLSDEMDSFAEEEQPSRPNSGASMNGRYPMISRSRNSSQQSIPRRPDGGECRGLHSMARSRKPSIETALHAHVALPSGRHRTISKPKSIAEIQAAARAEMIPQSDPCPAPTDPVAKSGKGFHRPRSAYELRVNYKNNATDRSKPLEVRRKMAEPKILEDHTILNIYAGPYASGGNHENQRPAELEGSGIPSLPSSEWLGSTKKGVRKASSRSGAVKQSPQRSPGQRMVTSWLDEKSKENAGAFV